MSSRNAPLGDAMVVVVVLLVVVVGAAAVVVGTAVVVVGAAVVVVGAAVVVGSRTKRVFALRLYHSSARRVYQPAAVP